MTTRAHKLIGWRNLMLAVIAAVFCFGGTFICTTGDDDDDNFHGAVVVREEPPQRHK